MVVLGIGAVAGVAALVGLTVDFGGSDPAPAAEPARPVVAAPPPAAAPEVVAEPATPRPSSRAASTAGPVPTAAPEAPAPAAPATATLRISSDVPDAQVFIDRKFIGMAPVTADGVEPGARQINVSAPGFEGVVETLEVAPGSRDVLISLKAIRLNESIAVTHKHGMGSCQGRLVATPEGLRYETDNKNDGFAVPLTSLETFKMDFAAKNLKVKIKGGRSYDFTDPGGSADPLYFFHQAVEKARLRMTRGPGTGGVAQAAW